MTVKIIIGNYNSFAGAIFFVLSVSIMEVMKGHFHGMKGRKKVIPILIKYVLMAF